MALDKKEVASMGDPSQAPTIKRVLAVTLLAALPAMFIAAYLVWTARAFLEGIHPLFYGLVLLLAMLGALWLTAGRLLKELREHAEWRREQRSKERGSSS
jgi:hypothetical protein